MILLLILALSIFTIFIIRLFWSKYKEMNKILDDIQELQKYNNKYK